MYAEMFDSWVAKLGELSIKCGYFYGNTFCKII